MNVPIITATEIVKGYGYYLIIEDGKIDGLRVIDRNAFTPEIQLPRRMFGTDYGWEIQTTGYGAQSPEDIKKVIEGYQNALKVVELLTAWDYPTR